MWGKLTCRVLRGGAGLHRVLRGGNRVRKFFSSYRAERRLGKTKPCEARTKTPSFNLALSHPIAIPNLQPKDLTHCPQILDHATNQHCRSYKNQIPVPILSSYLFVWPKPESKNNSHINK